MKHVISRLREMGYVVELDGCDILWRFSGTGQPVAGVVRKLLNKLRDHKEAAVTVLSADQASDVSKETHASDELIEAACRIFDAEAVQPFDSLEPLEAIDPFDRDNYPGDGTVVVLTDLDQEGCFTAHRVGSWPPEALGQGHSDLEAVDELLALEGAPK